MSLLRKTRAEMAGAWRSIRYDLGRRPAEPPAGGPDVTSTGMSTFGGLTSYPQAPVVAPARRPRRAVTAGAFGVLTVVGATAAYLGVVNGLGSLTSEKPAAADTFPARPAATAKAQIGQGPAPGRAVAKPTKPAAALTPAEAAEAARTPAGAAGAAAAAGATQVRKTAKQEKSPACACGGEKAAEKGGEKGTSPANPPVPTPTAPTSAPSPTPSASDSTKPSPSESATPGDSTEPSESPQARHRRRHH
jgi:hypothetical protein